MAEKDSEKSYSQLLGKKPDWLNNVSDRTAHSLKVLHGFKTLNDLKLWLIDHEPLQLQNLGWSCLREVNSKLIPLTEDFNDYEARKRR